MMSSAILHLKQEFTTTVQQQDVIIPQSHQHVPVLVYLLLYLNWATQTNQLNDH